MDVKSAFLNGKLTEEVYVKQPLSFESSEFPNHVYKLDKALYGLKQAPRAWYETLSTFLIEHKFMRDSVQRYQANPKESHLIVVKRSFMYLKGKALQMKSQLTDYDIIYEKGTLKYISFPLSKLADIFTKPLDELTFKRLIVELGNGYSRKGQKESQKRPNRARDGKDKGERKSLTLKAKKESSDEECLTSKSEEKEYAWRLETLKSSLREENGPKPRRKNQRAFVGGSWSDSGEEDDEKVKDETCLVAQASSEIICLDRLKPDEWIKDNGCSKKHIRGTEKLFSSYKVYNEVKVFFGSNLRGNIIGKGYSQNNKAYIILNKHTRKVEELLNVTFDETPPPSKTSPLVDDGLDEEEAIKVTEKKNLEKDIEDEPLEIDEIVNIKEYRNHPLQNVIGNLNQRTLRSQAQNQSNFFCFISTIEPKNVNEALADEIAQGYNQQEGIDYDETYAPVARLESIRILLAYACALDFKLFQMDVKSAFLNGFINEEVYVAQPPGFIDFEKPDHVYKLKKALYGLKQAPKAWYDRLKAFLIKHEYKMGMVDNTLFTKKKSSNLIIVQIYVDDIIFGSTCQDMCDEFAKIMHDEFEMSMMGELNFFLGLQIKQMEDGIFFNQSKYIKEMLKKFGLEESKPMKTPMSSDTKLTKDEECESVDSTKYRGMIGSLLYLTASRPDIMFSVCLCARFQEAPKTSHLEAVKRIF
ncbi:retrovirus-related pol polyprotein from transposon TNT 1-94 [Tanacetum coccineum]